MYHALVRRFSQLTFRLWESLGFHLTPNHFYQPIPDTSLLDEKVWSNHTELVGIEMNEERQLELLTLFDTTYREEYSAFPSGKTDVPGEYYLDNLFFVGVDAEILYCMIRHFRPRKIVEIGSGHSTRLSTQAIRKNLTIDPSYECDLIAIDPYPRDFLKAGVPGLTRLLSKNVQDVPLTEFSSLKENDILFVDSSHVLKIGSDVQYEFLEILPRLARGVFIHVHDIFLPMEYPREWVLERHWFYNEQYLLQAFLTYNDAFEVIWAGSYLHRNHPDKLAAAFPSYHESEQWLGRYWVPSSFWLRKTR